MKQSYRLLVAGSRSFDAYPRLSQALDKLLSHIKDSYDIEIVAGTARGADKLAIRYAKEHGYSYKEFPADWSLGKGAGFIRNEQMHKYLARVAHRGVILFWDGQSHGTIHNKDLAKKYRTPLMIDHYLTGELEIIKPGRE